MKSNNSNQINTCNKGTSKQEKYYSSDEDNIEDGRESVSQQQQQDHNDQLISLCKKPSPTKMLTFIDSLYSKFKLLNKLTQQQSSNFQTQIIQMLIDENQCVDAQLFQQTVSKIGIGTFVLQVLGTVVQKRNKFKNQHEMNRNLQEIAKDIEKQRVQLVKRKKDIDKRELGLKKKEQQMIALIKEKAQEIQEHTKTSLLSIEEQTKKRIKSIIATLKSKQKQLTDKQSSLKQNITKIKQLQSQQKSIQEKLKLLQKKEKQRKSKQTTQKQQQLASQQNTKKLTQLKMQFSLLEQNNKKLQEEVQRLGKKLKTNEMAYRHLKDDTDKKLAKYTQLGENMELMGEEKARLVEEIGKYKQLNQKLRKQIQKCNKEYDHSLTVIKQLKKQKQTLTHKPKANTQSNQLKHTPLIFDDLDISQIQHPPTITQQNNFMTDRQIQQQDMSILHHVSESILAAESIIVAGNRADVNEELNAISRTVDIEKALRGDYLSNHDQESQQEESHDHQREKQYFVKKQQHKGLIKHMRTHNQTQKNKLSLKQRIQELKQQQEQQSQQQKQQVPHIVNQSVSLKQSNIALFDNYFSNTPATHSQKISTNIIGNIRSTDRNSTVTNSPTVQQDVHQQLLSEIGKFLHAQQEPCQSLKKLTQEYLFVIIKKISSSQMKYPRTLVEPFLQLLLLVLQSCGCTAHQHALSFLFTQQLIAFLQQVLLKFQAIVQQIQQKSIIILSRILLSYENHSHQHQQTKQKFTLKEKYLKSLKVKLLLEKDDFIRSNLNFLMEYE